MINKVIMFLTPSAIVRGSLVFHSSLVPATDLLLPLAVKDLFIINKVILFLPPSISMMLSKDCL